MSRFRAQGADCGGIAVWNLVAATRKRKREEVEEEEQDGTSNKSWCAVLCVHLLPAGFGIWLGQTQAQKKGVCWRGKRRPKEWLVARSLVRVTPFSIPFPLVLAPFVLFLAGKLVKDVASLSSHTVGSVGSNLSAVLSK